MKLIQNGTTLAIIDKEYSNIVVGTLAVFIGVILGVVFLVFSRNPLIAIMAVLFFFMGVLKAVSAKGQNVIIDKNTNNIRISSGNLFTSKSKDTALSQIKKVQLNGFWFMSGKGRNYNWNLKLLTSDGTAIDICFVHSITPFVLPPSLPALPNQIKTGKTIADFIGVPFEDARQEHSGVGMSLSV